MSHLMDDLTMDPSFLFTVQPMQVRDIPEVMAIEKDSFPSPWSATAYRHELTQNELSHFIVVRKRELPPTPSPGRSLARWLNRPKPQLPPILGYGGFWALDDEAHISTIAVQPEWRGRGLGELLLAAMIDLAASLNTRFVTLEVRVSNLVAQNLYRKYLFQEVGRRRRYYRDNDEDAVIMTTPPIDDPTFVETLHQHRGVLRERLRKVAIYEEKVRLR